jgi:hypothetical protein
MFPRFSRTLTRIASITLLLLNQLVPLSSLIAPTPAFAQITETENYPQSQATVIVKFNAESNTFGLTITPANEVQYTLMYTHDQNVQEALIGQATGENNKVVTQVFAGTCSGTDCRKHTNITGGRVELKIKHNNQLEDKTIEFQVLGNQTWVLDQGRAVTGPVEQNTTYLYPSNNEVKVRFTKLPAQPGNLTIQEVHLNAEQIKEVGAISDTAYEVTSDMTDGEFAYDLELPLTAGTAPKEPAVKFAESLDQLNTAEAVSQQTTTDADSILVRNLDHFTIFVVVNPASATSCGSCSGRIWQNPGNVVSSDNSYATVNFPALNLNQSSQELRADHLGLAIPSNAVIEGITVRIERAVNQLRLINARDNSVQLMKAGLAVGANYAVGTGYVTTDTYHTYGSSNDLWGSTWTPAELNDPTFGVSYSVHRPAHLFSQTARVDHIEVSVAYVAIDLTSPVGGENWVGGTTHPITWNAEDQDPGVDVSTIDLAYTTDGVNFTPIATGIPNTGSYDWLVPNIASATVQVRATVHDGPTSASDLSQNFTISLAPPVDDRLLFWVEENQNVNDIGWQNLGQWYTYDIYRDGAFLANVTGNSYADNISGPHDYEVRSLYIGNSEHQSAPQTPKAVAPHQFVIDDDAMTADSQTTGTFEKTGTWGAYSVNDGGYAASVLQNAVGGDSWSIAGAASGQTATWTTSANLNGFYDVYVQYICDSSRGTAAYDIYSGGFKRNASPVLVNQATTDGVTACGAQSTQSESGPVWVKLGRFSIINNQAKVVMTAREGEINMVADAVAFDFAGPAGVIQGRKFNDVNGNGFFDCSERCVPGRPNLLNNWTIHLFDNLWNIQDSMNTGDDSTVVGNVAKGQYRFAGLSPGEYYVCEEPQAGWIQTRPFDSLGQTVVDPNHPGYYCYKVMLNEENKGGMIKRGLRFGNFKLANISGYKWNDLNNDGSWNQSPIEKEIAPQLLGSGSEPGLANWTIFVDQNDNGTLDSTEQHTTTNETGHYLLTGFGPGVYRICEQNQPNWTKTYPTQTKCHSVTVNVSGATFGEYNFGNHYSEPSHGGGDNGGGNGGGGTGPSNPPVCTADAPQKAPGNLRLLRTGSNTVTLGWDPVSPVTHYALVFTRNSDGAQYGSTNIGNVTSYTINGISGQDAYTFEVFGVNGCKPGDRARVTSKVTGPVLTTRPTGSNGDVLGQTIEEATPSAKVVDFKPEVLGATQSCSNPWWKCLLFLVQGVVLVTAAGLLRKRHRGNWLIAALLTTLVVIAAIFLFFCSVWPWILIAAGVSFIGVVVAIIWHDEGTV